MDLSSERRDYSGQRLLEEDTPAEPLGLFASWLRQAMDAQLLDVTAMALSTASLDGRPSCRMVLLKGNDQRGLVFFTRYSTQKCADLQENPRGALLFHWRELDQQVRIEGRIERISVEESQLYFASRPRLSQLAARAASGLDRVPNSGTLDELFAEETARWAGLDVPMPVDWGGYRLSPNRLEFWQGRPNRLHDRLVYELEANGAWAKYRLAP